MKKLFVFGLLLSVSFSVINAKTAQASLLSLTQIMISSGITDQETVQHNIKIYRSILESIEKNTHNKSFVLNRLTDLSDRLNAQMSYVGYDFSSLIAPEIENALLLAMTAAKQNNISELKRNILEAKKQLAEISKNI